jgi:nitroreductase
MTISAIEADHLKKALTVDGVLPIIQSRWSPRSFSSREVDPADLALVFEAAHLAASSYNEQPWRFLVGTRNSLTYKKIFDSLGAFNQAWAGAAPVLILGAASTKLTHNGETNHVALYDLGASASYLTLQASAMGLATHQMAGFDADAARKAFEIPEVFTIGVVIALGYQGEPAALTNEKLLAQETTPRERKPLKDFVFSAWDTPADLG